MEGLFFLSVLKCSLNDFVRFSGNVKLINDVYDFVNELIKRF